MQSKERLYHLIRLLVKNQCEIKSFCNDFTDLYNLEIDYQTLTREEQMKFKELAMITSRFSPFEDDLLNYDCYYSEQQIRDKVQEVIKQLNIQVG
ncbi:self-protective colicin-like immunity protein [Hydrogenispora ethanolica]|uniref:Self-protective colicin-like immunity protein n=1 Tax=Hydrogenispora ethanolica TaxID=1082276 RepID=A0A4R1RXT5_HYDET|nr:hypothetical protein [Hydrogenispora ethanolica]TCL71551.1 self-protective colicin-like immunity protein [Hydrogenispora ethanolica]